MQTIKSSKNAVAQHPASIVKQAQLVQDNGAVNALMELCQSCQSHNLSSTEVNSMLNLRQDEKALKL